MLAELVFTELVPLLLLGFGLGLMHALDADHIMAVSVLTSQKPSLRKTVLYSSHWALGHGGVLLASGLLLFGLGFAIPPSLQYLAELSVGVLLIGLGIIYFFRFKRDNIQLATHRHGDIVHTHWHTNSAEHESMNLHKPVLVGVLHGLAGSAPALALIPAVAGGQTLQAMLYLVLFSLGVMISMSCFGLGFVYFQRFLSVQYQRVFLVSRYILALASIGLGGFWLSQAI